MLVKGECLGSVCELRRVMMPYRADPARRTNERVWKADLQWMDRESLRGVVRPTRNVGFGKVSTTQCTGSE